MAALRGSRQPERRSGVASRGPTRWANWCSPRFAGSRARAGEIGTR